MAKIIIFTQNTMASIVATREVLRKNHHAIDCIVLASQFRGESPVQQLRVIYRLIRKSSPGFLGYKLVESKLYNGLLLYHRLRKSRRYREGSAATIKELARRYQISIMYANDLSNEQFLQEINQRKPDYIFCLVAQILRKNVFATLGDKLLNAHGSYLPEYRGAAQYVWYLLHDRKEFGVTIHSMTEELDTGDIIFQRKFPYKSSLSVYGLHYMMARAFGEMFNEFVEHYADRKYLPRTKQDEAKATSTRMPLAEDFKELKKKGISLMTFNDFFTCL